MGDGRWAERRRRRRWLVAVVIAAALGAAGAQVASANHVNTVLGWYHGIGDSMNATNYHVHPFNDSGGPAETSRVCLWRGTSYGAAYNGCLKATRRHVH